MPAFPLAGGGHPQRGLGPSAFDRGREDGEVRGGRGGVGGGGGGGHGGGGGAEARRGEEEEDSDGDGVVPETLEGDEVNPKSFHQNKAPLCLPLGPRASHYSLQARSVQ